MIIGLFVLLGAKAEEQQAQAHWRSDSESGGTTPPAPPTPPTPPVRGSSTSR
jgi:hypothetical protein